jgi:hypothetical protein
MFYTGQTILPQGLYTEYTERDILKEFRVQRYASSNLIPLTGLLALLIAAVLGGLVLGAITYLISQAVYLIILFPLGMGAGGGMVVAWGVYRGKVRSPMVALGFGILAAMIVYGTYRYADYRYGFRGDLRDEIEDAFGERVSDTELRLLEEQFLQSEVGETGFIGYTKLYAREGFSIFSGSNEEGGITLKGNVAYLYWVVELLIAGGVAYETTRGGARRPFSEHTNEWFGKPSYLATVPPGNVYDVIDLLDQGNTAALDGRLTEQVGFPRTELALRTCSSASAPQYLAMDRITLGRNNRIRRSTIHGWLIDPPALDTLRRISQPTE